MNAYSGGIPFTYPNIPENMEIGLPDSDYFRCGIVEELVSELQQIIAHLLDHVEYDMSKYDWGKIADQTAKVTVYEKGLVHLLLLKK